MAKYILKITFNKDTEEIDSISEELIQREPCVYVDDLDISDYWDKETLKLIDKMYDVGVT
jgi:hypothetical protein